MTIENESADHITDILLVSEHQPDSHLTFDGNTGFTGFVVQASSTYVSLPVSVVEQMRDALKPFADQANLLTSDEDDDDQIKAAWYSTVPAFARIITAGELRRALAVYIELSALLKL